jgi:hypothetical protein
LKEENIKLLKRQNILNKRVYPSAQKILPGNSFTDDNKKVSKKVTYDDILSSLNMKVINGKLQIVRGDAEVVPPPQKSNSSIIVRNLMRM